MAGWIGVDLDGTLAEYHGWKGAGHIGDPIPAMVARVKGWLAAGIEVRIFTARVGHTGLVATESGLVDGEEFCRQQCQVIADWCERHLGARLPVTCRKNFAMIELWDDRCVQVEANTGRRVDGMPDA